MNTLNGYKTYLTVLVAVLAAFFGAIPPEWSTNHVVIGLATVFGVLRSISAGPAAISLVKP